MRLIPRKRLDIGVDDLLAGLRACAESHDVQAAAARVESVFDERALACLSVRTGFDLVLRAMQVRRGDEIVMSGFTIPHMPQIARAHGCRVRAVDLDVESMTPDWNAMEAAIGPRTRALVVAHLFGGRVDTGPAVQLARRHGLRFIEDAAQAFDHGPWRGDTRADVSLFSFGPIKTATALGGGIAIVRDPRLRPTMRRLNASLPPRTNRSFARRSMRYLGIDTLSKPSAYGSLAAVCDGLGIDFDARINALTRSFRRGSLLAALRYRPSPAQLSLLARRLTLPGGSRIRARERAGRRVAASLPRGLRLAGHAADHHTHWLFPVLTPEPEVLMSGLRERGFDATRGGSTLAPIEDDEGGPRPTSLPALRAMAAQLVYLPVDGTLNDPDLERLIEALREPTPQTRRRMRSWSTGGRARTEAA